MRMTVPGTSPLDHPNRYPDETSWPLGNDRWVGSYLTDDGNWQVMQVGFRCGKEYGLHVLPEDADAEAKFWWVLITGGVTA